jgi:hypothetical protein
MDASTLTDVTLKRRRPTPLNTMNQAAAGRLLGLTTARIGQLIEEGQLPAYDVEGFARRRVLIIDVRRLKRWREIAPRVREELREWPRDPPRPRYQRWRGGKN